MSLFTFDYILNSQIPKEEWERMDMSKNLLMMFGFHL